MFPGVAMSRDDLLFIEYRFSSELSFFFFFFYEFIFQKCNTIEQIFNKVLFIVARYLCV